jgi:hypothetical protein
MFADHGAPPFSSPVAVKRGCAESLFSPERNQILLASSWVLPVTLEFVRYFIPEMELLRRFARVTALETVSWFHTKVLFSSCWIWYSHQIFCAPVCRKLAELCNVFWSRRKIVITSFVSRECIILWDLILVFSVWNFSILGGYRRFGRGCCSIFYSKWSLHYVTTQKKNFRILLCS